MKILIVDDSKYMREIIREILENYGYQIVGLAKTGKEAIRLAKESNPDLITLDAFLSDMKGIELIRHLKKQDAASKFLVISTVRQRQLLLEANNYLAQPFTVQTLLQKIKSMTDQPSVTVL